MSVIKGKVVLLGDSGVGKSSIINRYINDAYHPRNSATIGAFFYKRTFCIESFNLTLEIWDTAGMERFRGITSMYYRNADSALIFFDITSRDSFEEIRFWIKELKNNSNKLLFLFIVGNKVDLDAHREIFRDEAEQYAQEVGAHYYECSALNGQGVQEIFEDVAQNIFTCFDPKNCLKQFMEIRNDETVNLNSPKIKRKKINCCNNNT